MNSIEELFGFWVHNYWYNHLSWYLFG